MENKDQAPVVPVTRWFVGELVRRATQLTLFNSVRQARKDIKPVAARVEALDDLMQQLGPVLKAMCADSAQLHGRIKALEARAGSGVTILSQGGLELNAPGMDLVAGAVERLEQTLAAPLKPVYDAKGKLVHAVRQSGAASGAGKDLEQRVAALESKAAALKYVGVYKAGNVYEEQNFCTHDGSLWHANARTSARPGTDATWTLAVKRGKDAAR